MDDCIFCKIARKEIPSEMLLETDNLFVIKDIHPKAPVHLLVVTKKHIPSINEVANADGTLIGEVVLAAKQQAAAAGIAESGYKLVWNVGKHGGQVVPHIHLHVIGGKQLSE